jgi:WD40 repeat protein
MPALPLPLLMLQQLLLLLLLLQQLLQVDVRNQRGQHASGKKVTSIAAVPGQPQQFLITTNDSRLRLLEGYGQVLKFKGHRNSSTQARAALSPNGAQLACGSDDGCLYLWQRDPSGSASSGGAAAADAGAGARGGAQQRGGGADRARSMAAAAAAQYQHLMSKNASYQAFQAHDPGQPVTAVAFVPPAAAGLPKLSVMLNSGTAGAGGGAAAAEAVHWDSRKCFVQQLVVSAGFNGSIRVHELLGSRPR